MPTEADADWGMANRKWGCTVKATKWYSAHHDGRFSAATSAYVAPKITCDRRTKLRVRTILWQRWPDGSKSIYKRSGSRAISDQVVTARPGRLVPVRQPGNLSGVGVSVGQCYDQNVERRR